MRLSHHLAFKDLWRHIHEAVMAHAKKFVRKSTLIIIDPSDVQKPYAKKMQYFVMVWIGKSERREVLRTHIVETAKRIYGAPEFFYYAHPC